MMKIEWVIGAPFVCSYKDGTLVINYERWMELSKEERKFVLEHEKLHELFHELYFNKVETGH